VLSRPRLTQVGSVRARGSDMEHGGYYTQEEVREHHAGAAASRAADRQQLPAVLQAPGGLL
jgi:hypothetical protein